jgi:hypothetical protein
MNPLMTSSLEKRVAIGCWTDIRRLNCGSYLIRVLYMYDQPIKSK